MSPGSKRLIVRNDNGCVLRSSHVQTDSLQEKFQALVHMYCVTCTKVHSLALSLMQTRPSVEGGESGGPCRRGRKAKRRSLARRSRDMAWHECGQGGEEDNAHAPFHTWAHFFIIKKSFLHTFVPICATGNFRRVLDVLESFTHIQ